MYHVLGIDQNREYHNEAQRPLKILNHGEPIRGIIVTHGHLDHILNVAPIARGPLCVHFSDDFHTFATGDVRSRPPSLILLPLDGGTVRCLIQ